MCFFFHPVGTVAMITSLKAILCFILFKSWPNFWRHLCAKISSVMLACMSWHYHYIFIAVLLLKVSKRRVKIYLLLLCYVFLYFFCIFILLFRFSNIKLLCRHCGVLSYSCPRNGGDSSVYKDYYCITVAKLYPHDLPKFIWCISYHFHNHMIMDNHRNESCIQQLTNNSHRW